jgi:catechol 2,3-dioxygenase-like lactoylglutathione lyase family enzyme
MADPAVCRRPKTRLKIAVEVNRIVVPARDKRATAELLACILGLEVEADSGRFVRIRSKDGLTLDFSEPEAGVALQCAFLVSGPEFDSALLRINRGAINFYAAFDGTGRGEINRLHGGRGIYFDDPDGHLYELIERLDASAIDSCIKSVAIKCRGNLRSGGRRSLPFPHVP